MAFAKVVTKIGVALLILAWLSASFIPTLAYNDAFYSLGRGSIEQNIANVKVCANLRMLQNSYVGIAGLICLSIGLLGWKEHMRPSS
jgi:hypothetical protein